MPRYSTLRLSLLGLVFLGGVMLPNSACDGQKGDAAELEMGEESEDITMIKLERVYQKISFTTPLEIRTAGDDSGRLFVVSREGEVLCFSEDQDAEDALEATTFLDLTGSMSRMHNEEGLLSMAFHPKYAETGYLYVWYTAIEWKDEKQRKTWRNVKGRKGVLSRLSVDPKNANRVDPATEKVLLEVDQPWGNHNGGTVLFGEDGFLYLSIGDGGAADDPLGHGQNKETLLGTIIRIDVDKEGEEKPYSIPEDNPFVNEDGAAPEIWAYGLRNVWRMSFDPETGDLWAGDVGQNAYEEVDLIVSGGNYGWKWREGLHEFPKLGRKDKAPEDLDHINPVFEYERDQGTSITGGLVYRSEEFPMLQGIYLVGDYNTGRIWGLRKNESGLSDHRLIYQPRRGKVLPKISSFGVGESGAVYLTSFDDGKLYKIVPAESEDD